MKQLILNDRSQLLSFFLAFIITIVVFFCISEAAMADADIGCNALKGAKEEMGCWEKLPLPRGDDGKILPLESVHTSLLPDGKVLMVNGSSNRNTIVRDGEKVDFQDGVNTAQWDVINNTAILDPKTGEYEVIDSPPTEQNALPTNDLFCSGHVHLLDGNILFAGGTKRYYPKEQFFGSKQTNLYDWKNKTWSTPGSIGVGRWYPSLIPLADGKIVIFSGIDDPGQIPNTIDIYDPSTNSLTNSISLRVENSPFVTKIEEEGNDRDSIDLYPRIFPTPDGKLLITGDGAGKFPLELHKSHYSYLMSIEEQDGDKYGISFEIIDKRKDLPEDKHKEVVSRVYGTAVADPNNPGDVLLIGGLEGTNNINFGKPQLGAMDDPNSTNGKLKAAGAKIARSLERWDHQTKSWSVEPNFLDHPRSMNEAVILPNKEILNVNGGEFSEYKPVNEPLLMIPDESATMGYSTKTMNPATFPRLYHNGAILLPDARVLSISGNASRAAREADGTVHVDVVPGGSYYELAKITTTPNKADSVKVIPEEKYAVIPEEEYNDFIEDYYQHPDKYLVKEDNIPFVPAEIWQPEVFSPPYLFTPGSRPEITSTPGTYQYNQPQTIEVKNAGDNGTVVLIGLGSITHSLDYGQRLADLTIDDTDIDGEITYVRFQTPDNPNLYPPGYYMMFYVNQNGKPSVAKMVLLEA
ncbi:MAG: galactose oxidase-like domain-containing protein [Cyanobacteria bacterium P01_A01_bin.83]